MFCNHVRQQDDLLRPFTKFQSENYFHPIKIFAATLRVL